MGEARVGGGGGNPFSEEGGPREVVQELRDRGKTKEAVGGSVKLLIGKSFNH